MRNILIFVESRFPVNRSNVRKIINEFFDQEKLKKVEVSIAIIGDRKMKNLNKIYRGKDETTTVLAFALEDSGQTSSPGKSNAGFIDMPDDVLRLGDVAISYPQAVLRSGEDNMLVEDKLKELLIHGLKNLIGKYT